MAPRVSDYPDDEEWPDLEEELVGETTFTMGGAYAPAYEFLHGARVTLDAGLLRATRLLAAAAARGSLAIAAREGDEVGEEERTQLEAIGTGAIDAEAEALLDALTHLAVFVERRLKAPDAGQP